MLFQIQGNRNLVFVNLIQRSMVKRSSFRCLLFVALLPFFSSTFAQPAPSSDVYGICTERNAVTRKDLAAAPGMSKSSRLLGQLTLDDGICECIRSQDAASRTERSSDPMIRYISANSICMARHVNRRFDSVCSEVYEDLLPTMGYGPTAPEQITRACACASEVMKSKLTPQALQRSQIEQYRYFKALMEDRRNKTSKAEAIRPGLGALEQGMQGIPFCAIRIMGEPKKAAP